MTDIYFQDESVTLWHGSALDVLREIPERSVNCCVTSPPYFGLRDYGVGPSDWPAIDFAPMVGLPEVHVPSIVCSLGLEPTPWAFVAHLLLIFREVRRVLADDGVLWLNMGDGYSTRSVVRDSSHQSGTHPERSGDFSTLDRSWVGNREAGRVRMPSAHRVPEKNLFGNPWRTAFALQADGWILRNDNVWAKPNGMPEPAKDRLACRHEYIFLLSKSPRYWFNLDAIKVPTTGRAPGNTDENRRAYGRATGTESGARRFGGNESSTLLDVHETRNPGDVWTFPVASFPEAHFATFPEDIPKRCIASGCPPNGTVLDPFNGSGTTGLAAARLGRSYIGIDANAAYLDLSLRTRLAQSALIDGEAS